MEMNLDKLLFEKVFIIKYQTANGSGIMIVKEAHYLKKIKKFQKAFKDCDIYYMSACVLTPDIIKEQGL